MNWGQSAPENNGLWNGVLFSKVDHFCIFMDLCAIVVNDICYVWKQYLNIMYVLDIIQHSIIQLLPFGT